MFMSFPKKVSDKALVACARHCCLCHEDCGTNIHTHHITPTSSGGDNSYENCIPLCLKCHGIVGSYNPKHPIGRKYSPEELKQRRDEWYEIIEKNGPNRKENSNDQSVTQTVTGNNNAVAGRDINIRTEKVVKKVTVKTDPGGKHISNATARRITNLVKKYTETCIMAGDDPKKSSAKIWSQLKEEFCVTTYKEIDIRDSEKAIQWLETKINMLRPRIRRKDPEAWRRSFEIPIWAMAKELGLSKPEVYTLATDKYKLKKPINSLKELTQKNLEKLYNHIRYLKKKG